MKQELVAETLALPVSERVRLVDVIWDSIAEAPDALELLSGKRMSLIVVSQSSRLIQTRALLSRKSLLESGAPHNA